MKKKWEEKKRNEKKYIHIYFNVIFIFERNFFFFNSWHDFI